MINKKFIEETDKMIAQIQERGIRLENGNVLVAKVKVDRTTKGGLVLSEDTLERDDNRNGFGRILALPVNLDPRNGDAELKVGDYCLHSHEARYLPFIAAIREVLDYHVDEKVVQAVQDNDIILTISKDKVQ